MPRVRALAVLVLFVALTPPALATGEVIAIRDAHQPERTVAEHPFPLFVNVTNKGDVPRSVYLFAALYAPGATPCGPATDPRFRAFTPLVQARVDVPARATVAYPPAGESWLQRYHAKDVPPGDATMELCVFAAEDAPTGGNAIQYDDFVSLPLATRDANRAPEIDFMWTSGNLYAARDVEFHASGHDADGDPIRYHWDFGHANASGEATADGADAVHSFYPDGTYGVTLTASDGFDSTSVTHSLVIAPEPNTDTIGGAHGHRAPGVGALALVCSASVVAILMRDRRP